MYRQICLQGQLLRSRAFLHSLGTRQRPPWKPCVNVDSSCFSSQKESQRVTPSRNSYLEQCGVEGGHPRDIHLKQWGVGAHPRNSDLQQQGWGHTPETATNCGGWRGTPQKQPLGTVGWGTPHTYLFVLPQKLPILAEKTLLTISCGGELGEKTKEQSRERCFFICLLLFLLFLKLLYFIWQRMRHVFFKSLYQWGA